MKITPENQDDIVAIIAQEFRSFGGGNTYPGNPLSVALKDKEPQFAAGVNIEDVAERIIDLYEENITPNMLSALKAIQHLLHFGEPSKAAKVAEEVLEKIEA